MRRTWRTPPRQTTSASSSSPASSATSGAKSSRGRGGIEVEAAATEIRVLQERCPGQRRKRRAGKAGKAAITIDGDAAARDQPQRQSGVGGGLQGPEHRFGTRHDRLGQQALLDRCRGASQQDETGRLVLSLRCHAEPGLLQGHHGSGAQVRVFPENTPASGRRGIAGLCQDHRLGETAAVELVRGVEARDRGEPAIGERAPPRRQARQRVVGPEIAILEPPPTLGQPEGQVAPGDRCPRRQDEDAAPARAAIGRGAGVSVRSRSRAARWRRRRGRTADSRPCTPGPARCPAGVVDEGCRRSARQPGP